MNSLYTLGLRQISSIQADIDRLRTESDSPIALQGQIAASLAALNRTVDDYDSMAKREMIKSKQEKAFLRVQKFRSDYNDLRKSFDHAKRLADNSVTQRATLFQSSSSSLPPTPSARQRFSGNASNSVSESPFNLAPQPTSRVERALDEHSFLQETETQLDNFLAQGMEVWNNLKDQKEVLKGTQRRLLSAANTLGLSRDVIGWIERRSREDTVIFVIGAIFTFFCFWLIWHYLG
ncbi:uncharacterized protein EI90DRAFT_2918150 [Cantharellus anzutake]|uniref:uncharacterized protein n=1 Tax=Cantharellus anzutake TaxID=1750568 RepID=UPI001904DE2D|nr:uncharacterized protein EI90DRAFT_2918150 [Cantharellus anzutake]KAF8332658.1 hypothetical protein EI90DRAFT_2918150 [Cantharellus anzutake]